MTISPILGVPDPPPEVHIRIETTPLATIELHVSDQNPIISNVPLQDSAMGDLEDTTVGVASDPESHVDCLSFEVGIF
jgi:hypothetical protein